MIPAEGIRADAVIKKIVKKTMRETLKIHRDDGNSFKCDKARALINSLPSEKR